MHLNFDISLMVAATFHCAHVLMPPPLPTYLPSLSIFPLTAAMPRCPGICQQSVAQSFPIFISITMCSFLWSLIIYLSACAWRTVCSFKYTLTSACYVFMVPQTCIFALLEVSFCCLFLCFCIFAFLYFYL